MPEVQDPNQYPYSCVGLLHVTLADGRTGWGTGALIHERYVVTCAHNIVNQGQPATSAVFYRAYSSNSEPDPDGGIHVEAGFVKKAFTDGDRSWDIGIYRLQSPRPLPTYVRLTIVEPENIPPNIMDVAGYTTTHYFKMWEDQETVSGYRIDQHVFSYTHQTEPGSSGSPLYKMQGGTAHVYGVHSGLAENLEDRVGVLITQVTYGFVEAAVQRGQDASFVVVID